jgi:hypothetical protein
MRPIRFPLAEGACLFIGILAWDLLSEGRLNLIKALSITIPVTLAWYAIRYLARRINLSRNNDRRESS